MLGLLHRSRVLSELAIVRIGGRDENYFAKPQLLRALGRPRVAAGPPAAFVIERHCAPVAGILLLFGVRIDTEEIANYAAYLARTVMRI